MNGALGVKGDIAVDHEHLMHLPVEVGIALLQVVADLVRFELVLVEDAPDRTLAGTGKTRKPGLFRLFANIARQRRNAPQFCGQADILGLGACHADDPSLCFAGDFGLIWTMVGILQSRLNACRQRLVDALVDHRPTHPQLSLYFADRLAFGVLEQHAGAFNLSHGRRARTRQFRQHHPLLVRQHQCRPSACSCHDRLPSKVHTESWQSQACL